MGGGLVGIDRDVPPPVPSRDARLDPGAAYFVHVCNFTFEFWSVEQIAHALNYFETGIDASERRPSSWKYRQEMIEANPARWREVYDSFVRCHHYEMQRWFERLPQHLKAKNKKSRVVAALRRALAEFESDNRKGDNTK